jgi:hypothetical protein
METWRRSLRAGGFRVALVVLGAISLQGCAALGLSLLAVGAGTAAGQGVSYTLDSIAYKTFTASIDGLEAATLRALDRMDIAIKKNEAKKEGGRAIDATAGDRAVEIELDRLTERTSRMRVVVKQGWFFKDKATATEVILQTAQIFDDHPALARLARTTASSPVKTRPAARAGAVR